MGFLDNIFLGSEIERGQELDRQIRELNAQKEAKGVLTSGQRQAADANLERESPAVWERQINDDFMTGLDQGYENVTGAIKAGINAPARFIWDSVPWWVWILGIGVIAWQLKAVRAWARQLTV